MVYSKRQRWLRVSELSMTRMSSATSADRCLFFYFSIKVLTHQSFDHWAFAVATFRMWNFLPRNVTSVPSPSVLRKCLSPFPFCRSTSSPILLGDHNMGPMHYPKTPWGFCELKKPIKRDHLNASENTMGDPLCEYSEISLFSYAGLLRCQKNYVFAPLWEMPLMRLAQKSWTFAALVAAVDSWSRSWPWAVVCWCLNTYLSVCRPWFLGNVSQNPSLRLLFPPNLP